MIREGIRQSDKKSDDQVAAGDLCWKGKVSLPLVAINFIGCNVTGVLYNILPHTNI